MDGLCCEHASTDPYRIWIDADSCPHVIRKILYRASERKGFPLVMVANTDLSPPESALISTMLVERGSDFSDHQIVAGINLNVPVTLMAYAAKIISIASNI